MADLTPEQYEKAIGIAQREGNKPALEALLQEYSAKVTGPGNFMQRLGAGFSDVKLAGKQMLGMTTPEEIKQHNVYANQAVGDTIGGHVTRALPLAMTALIPGGQRVAGAAGLGALAGVMTPTEDENMWAGKATQALTGGLTGGAVQHGLNVAAPALKATMGKIRDFLPGGAARVAERDFLASIPEAERAAAQQALQGAASARTAPMAAGTSGAPISTAAALGAASPKGQFSEGTSRLLSAEREAREAGGLLGQRFRNMDEAAAQQRWQHLEQNVGGDIPLLTADKKAVYSDFMQRAKNLKPGDFDPKDRLWREINQSIDAEHNPAIKSELTRIRDHYLSAKTAGDLPSLHSVRQEAMDDTLSRLYQSDKKAANSAARTIQGFRNTFDKEMDRALGPGRKWSDFNKEYTEAATALKQAERGEDFLNTARTWNETPGGVPQLTGKRTQMGALASETDDYGRGAVAPAASDALQTVRREIGEQMLPTTAGPRGSATAQNLNPTSPVLTRALAAQRRSNQGVLAPENLAQLAVFEPMTAVGGMLGLRALDKRALTIADQLMKIYSDPQQAAQILAKANLPQPVKDRVLAELAKRVTAQSAAGQAVQQINEPQEQ